MANKKINQLVAKTTILSTDLFPLGNPTTGQLFKKTIGELQAAIGGAVISVNGLVGTVVLDTDDIQELASPTNRYFTDARARGAISLTVSGNSGASTYSSSTGVLNVPTYTLAGLGGITATFLSGASGIAYNSSTGVITYTGTVYTDASIRALFSAGTGITYNSSTGAISYSGTVYTDASIRALISLTTSGSSGASTYNNTTGVLNVPTYTLAGLGGISLTSLSGTAPITYNSSTGAIGITQASGSTNGFLSSTDWTTFNSKQSALTLGNVTESVSNVLMFPDGGTNKTVGNLSIQVVQAGSTTNGFLSSTNWNTFNNKQNAITLTTTGTSGAATFTSNTLNIPQYQAVLTNPVTGTGTTNFLPKWTSSSALGNSLFTDNGTNGALGGQNYSAGTGVTSFNVTAPSFAALAFFTGTSQYTADIFAYTGSGNLIIAADPANQLSSTNLQLSVDGSTRLSINSSGFVGINTLDQTSLLFVNSGESSTFDSTADDGQASLGSTITVRNGSTTTNTFSQINMMVSADSGRALGRIVTLRIGSGTSDMVFVTENANVKSEKMRITGDGKIGIGTTTPTGNLEVVTSATSTIRIKGNSTTGFDIQNAASEAYLWNRDNGRIYFATNNTERGQITAGGNWLLGTTSDNGERLYVSGSIRATGSITANSDARLKKNIERIENALEKVGQISGYTYNTIYDEERHAGVIAQEIDKVLPEIVNKGNDGLMGVEYGNISALLIEAIKDLKKDNESLRAIVEGLSK